jgi:hypothetical protein
VRGCGSVVGVSDFVGLTRLLISLVVVMVVAVVVAADAVAVDAIVDVAVDIAVVVRASSLSLEVYEVVYEEKAETQFSESEENLSFSHYHSHSIQ